MLHSISLLAPVLPQRPTPSPAGSRPATEEAWGDGYAGPTVITAQPQPPTAPSVAPPPASPAVAAFCKAAWPVLGVRVSEKQVYGEQMDLRRAVFGEPRLNRPYPDPDLLAAGLPQSLPLDVHTPFKWLLSPPQVVGDVVLLHAQHEGGPGWCGEEELECRDLFIAVRENPTTHRFEEVAHLQTKPSEYAYVYRSTGAPDLVAGSSEHFLVRLEEGTYSTGIFARHTHLYQIGQDEIREIATFQGHLQATAPEVDRAVQG